MKKLSTRTETLPDGSVITATRYRVEVEGVRVALMVRKYNWASTGDALGTEIGVDFWTPKTRWKLGAQTGAHGWENPTRAMRAIASAIVPFYERALDQGWSIIVEAACERRLAIYKRIAKG